MPLTQLDTALCGHGLAAHGDRIGWVLCSPLDQIRAVRWASPPVRALYTPDWVRSFHEKTRLLCSRRVFSSDQSAITGRSWYCLHRPMCSGKSTRRVLAAATESTRCGYLSDDSAGRIPSYLHRSLKRRWQLVPSTPAFSSWFHLPRLWWSVLKTMTGAMVEVLDHGASS